MATSVVTPVPAPPQVEPVVTPQPTPPVEGTPQQNSRQELYNKYYADNGITPTPAQPVPPEGTLPPAQDPSQPGLEPQPQPVVEPPAPTPDPTQILLAKIAELEAKLVPPAPPTPTMPQAPQAPAVSVEDRWVESLQKGDFKGAMEIMMEEAENRVRKNVANTIVQDTLAISRVEQDIESFVNETRKANPELAPFEGFVTTRVEARMTDLTNSGQIKNPIEWAAEYKKVLTETIGEARKLYQSIRATGTNDATVRQKEIISQSAVPVPQPVAERGLAVKEPERKPETANDYVARRQQLSAQRRGISL